MSKDLGIILLREGAELPSYEHEGDSGFDLRVLLDEDVVLYEGSPVILPTGLSFDIPDGYEVQIRPRSGLACKFGVTVVNSPGTIDAGYTGEIKIGLINLNVNPYLVRNGERVAQAVLAPVTRANICLEHTQEETSRGSGGFGSTGSL